MTLVHAVVPVAGLGTRLLPATKSQPKEMLPVGKSPVVQYVVEELERNGFNQVLFVTGAAKNAIENHFDLDPDLVRHLRESGKEKLLQELSFLYSGTRFFYTRQREQLGLGDAVLYGEPFTGDAPFAVALGDSILGRHAQSRTLSHMKEVFTKERPAAVVAFREVAPHEVGQYGIAEPAGEVCAGESFALRDLIEKPSPAEAPSCLAVAARYIFAPSIYAALHQTQPGKGGEIQLTDAIRSLMQSGERVLGVTLPPGEERYDIGNFESYFKAFLDFALFDPVHGGELRRHARRLLDGVD
jgi:UTP--glucose-1-phosphate uridylyltransferase